MTSVPSWTGVPPPSMTVAVICADPPRLMVVKLLKTVMDEFDGATSAQQVRENCGVLGLRVRLGARELARLRRIGQAGGGDGPG